jgi:hypothetical protein
MDSDKKPVASDKRSADPFVLNPHCRAGHFSIEIILVPEPAVVAFGSLHAWAATNFDIPICATTVSLESTSCHVLQDIKDKRVVMSRIGYCRDFGFTITGMKGTFVRTKACHRRKLIIRRGQANYTRQLVSKNLLISDDPVRFVYSPRFDFHDRRGVACLCRELIRERMITFLARGYSIEISAFGGASSDASGEDSDKDSGEDFDKDSDEALRPLGARIRERQTRPSEEQFD